MFIIKQWHDFWLQKGMSKCDFHTGWSLLWVNLVFVLMTVLLPGGQLLMEMVVVYSTLSLSVLSSRTLSVHSHSCYIIIYFEPINRLSDSTCHHLHSLFSHKHDKSGDQSGKWKSMESFGYTTWQRHCWTVHTTLHISCFVIRNLEVVVLCRWHNQWQGVPHYKIFHQEASQMSLSGLQTTFCHKKWP